MTFTLEHLEFYLLILMRVSGFIMTAPLFVCADADSCGNERFYVLSGDSGHSGCRFDVFRGVWIFSTRFERIYDWCGSWIDVQYVFLHY